MLRSSGPSSCAGPYVTISQKKQPGILGVWAVSFLFLAQLASQSILVADLDHSRARRVMIARSARVELSAARMLPPRLQQIAEISAFVLECARSCADNR